MEPKLGHFLAILKNKNFEVSNLLTGEDKDLNVREMLIYLDENQVESTFDEIKKMGDKKAQETVIQNLTLLYPLSRPLMLKIFDGIDKSDHDFIKKFDIENELCKRMLSTLNEMKEQVGTITSTGYVYANEIERLQNEINALESRYHEQTEITKLEKQKKEWEDKLNKENLDSKRAELKQEINKHKGKIKAIQDEKKVLENQKRKVIEELRDLERNLDDTQQKKLLKQFLETCPKDEVDEK